MPSTPSTSNNDLVRKKAADYEQSKQRISKRREQAQNSAPASNNSITTIITEPPPPPTSSSSILTSALAATRPCSVENITEPPPPPTSSSSILSHAISHSEDTSRDTTLPPSISNPPSGRTRRRSTRTSTAAAIARKQADLHNLETSSRAPTSTRRRNNTQRAHVSFDPSVTTPATPPRATQIYHDECGSPNTNASSHFASSTVSSLTTDSFIERKRQTMDWPSALPERNEEQQEEEEDAFEEEFSSNRNSQEYAVPPPPPLPAPDLEDHPIIHVQATPVFEDDQDDVKEHPLPFFQQKKKNPFKDWRVMVFVMIMVSTIVGLTVGLVMKGGNGGNESVALEKALPESGGGDITPTTPEEEEKDMEESAPKIIFAFSMELSTSDVNSIDTAALVGVTKTHMAEAMGRIVDSFEDIELNVTLVASEGRDGVERTRGGRKLVAYPYENRRRMAVVTAIFDAIVTLEDDSTVPSDESAFVENVLSTSFSTVERENLVESMEDAGLGVTALSSPTALAVVEDDVSTDAPTSSPTAMESDTPSKMPTDSPTKEPTTSSPTLPPGSPTKTPSISPSAVPTTLPTVSPSSVPSKTPTKKPTTSAPTPPPGSPTKSPSASPTAVPTTSPSVSPSSLPSASPSMSPTLQPSASPTVDDFTSVTAPPTVASSNSPSKLPSSSPTSSPTMSPSSSPTVKSSSSPSAIPSFKPSASPTQSPTPKPSASPTRTPTSPPTPPPTNPSESRTLQTSYSSKFSRSGAMFDVTSLHSSSLTITSMYILIDLTSNMISNADNIEIEVWTRDGGSYQSYEKDEAAWTWRNNKQPYTISSNFLLQDGTGTNGEERLVSIPKDTFDPIEIPAGKTFGVYVTLRLGRGMVVGQDAFVDQDENLRITSGTSNAYRFGVTNSPRNWNGALNYVLG